MICTLTLFYCYQINSLKYNFVIVPHKTVFLDDDDNISDGDEDDSKDKINSSKFDNRTPKWLTMVTGYVMVMLNYCRPNTHDFAFALFASLVTQTKIMNNSQ